MHKNTLFLLKNCPALGVPPTNPLASVGKAPRPIMAFGS